MTDFIVFAIGGTTSLPSLRSYSLYSAMGILFSYLYQTTFFVACLALDTKRIDDNRNGMFCCIKHKNFKPNTFSQRNWMQEFFQHLGTYLKATSTKITVIGFTVIITAFGIFGNALVTIEFDYVKFLPESTNLFQWYRVHSKYFPMDGYMGNIHFAELDIQS